jgi:hypothetical protein
LVDEIIRPKIYFPDGRWLEINMENDNDPGFARYISFYEDGSADSSV